MTMQNSRTRKYIDRYCEYIDRLIHYWKDGTGEDEIDGVEARANFIHHILGINKKTHRFFGKLINSNIHSLYYNLEDYTHDPEYTKHITEQMALREEHILDCKALALKISSPIKEIESSPYKGPATEDELEELLCSLKHIKKAMACNFPINEVEGANANRLVVEQGFISKWLRLAIKTGLTEGRAFSYKVYSSLGIFHDFTLDGEPVFKYKDSDKKKIDRWIEKVKEKLEGFSQDAVGNTIPPQYRTAPTSKTRLVNAWGGDMTITVLRNMIENKRLRCIEHTRQTCTFDTRQLPEYVVKALKE